MGDIYVCFSDAAYRGGEFVGRVHLQGLEGRTLCGVDTTRRGWTYEIHDDADDTVSCRRCCPATPAKGESKNG